MVPILESVSYSAFFRSMVGITGSTGVGAGVGATVGSLITEPEPPVAAGVGGDGALGCLGVGEDEGTLLSVGVSPPNSHPLLALLVLELRLENGLLAAEDEDEEEAGGYEGGALGGDGGLGADVGGGGRGVGAGVGGGVGAGVGGAGAGLCWGG